MSWSAQQPENSVQQKKPDTVDLTDERDDSVDPSSTTSHRLPDGASPTYPRRPDSSSVPFEGPTGGYTSFPLRAPGAQPPQPPQPGYTPSRIAQQYSPHSYAASRKPLLDQSKVAPQARRHSDHERRQPPPPPPPQPYPHPSGDQSSFNRVVGSSLRVRGNHNVTSGPRKQFESRSHAPAIAQAPFPVDRQHRAPSQPRDRPWPSVGQHGPRYAPSGQPPFHHQGQPPKPPPQQPVRLDVSDDEHAKSPPRKVVLPPGFPAPPPSSLFGFYNTFTSSSTAHVAVHHRTDSLDLRSTSPPPRSPPAPPPSRQYFGAAPTTTFDMSRNAKATPITPSDPSVRKAVSGAGWNNGFDDDDDDHGAAGRPPAPRQDKGKGRMQQGMTPKVFVPEKRGRAGSQAAVVKGIKDMKSYKTAPSAVSPGVFHGTPHASTSASTSHMAHPAATSSSASRGRVIYQDDPQTEFEMRGAAEKERVKKQLAGTGKKKKPAAVRAPANGTAARGGRKKKEVPVVELSDSGDEDDEDDPIRTSDDDRAVASSSYAVPHSHSRASTSGQPTLHVKGAAAAQAQQKQQQQRQRGHSDDFSDDELAMHVPPRKTQALVKVNELVEGYEKMGQNRPSVAQSLKGKSKPQPRVDGGPTDGGELNVFPTATAGKRPRAAQESIDKGKGKAKLVENALQDQVRMTPIEGFFVGRQAVPIDYAHATYTLLYNLRGKPKITVRRKRQGGEPEDVCDFQQKDVERVSYNDVLSDELVPYLEFDFKKDRHASTILEQLAQVCDSPSAGSEPGRRTVLFPFKVAPHEDWQNDPTLALDHVFKLCADDWAATKAAHGVARAATGFLHGSRRNADDLAQQLDKRAARQSGKGKSSQSKLSFSSVPVTAKAPRLHTDAAGDLVETGDPPRRSTRPSTSAFAGDGQVAAARQALAKPRSVSPFGAEEHVLEYPMNEAGAVSVTWGDTKRLGDEEFLNDTLIEFGLKRIMKDIEDRDVGRPDDDKLAPQIHVFNSFFYKQLSSKKDLKRGMDPYLLVEKWTKRVDLFKKRFIVVPINEYLHWYLAIIVNPAAILKPPPPAAAPRKSGRKRVSTVDSDYAVGSPGGSPEVASKHFGGAGRGLREAEPEDMVDEEDEVEQEAQRANEKVARDVAAHEQRKAHDHDREVQAAVASVAAQKKRSSASAGPVDEMDLDEDARVASTSAVAGSSLRGPTVSADGVIDDEVMLESSQSPPPPGQGDVHMRAEDEMSEVDVDVTRVRPEVEGGGPGKADRHVVISPSRSQRQHTRFADNDDDDVVVQEQQHERAAVAPPVSDDSDASLESPDKLGKGKQRLRRGSKKEVVDAEPAPPPPEHGKQLDRITLDDDDDDNLHGPVDPAPTSAPMQKATSASSAVTSTSGSSTSTARTPASAAADTEPTSRSAPASTTCGSASSSGLRKSVVAAPTSFTPQDPEPDREKQLAREREEEEEARLRARAAEEAELSEKLKSSADTCWILTFDSLGAPHKQVANRVRDYLKREAASKRGIDEVSTDAVQVVKVEVPQQPNSCDCGLYLLHFVETFFKDPQLYLDAALRAHLQPPTKSKDKGKKDAGKKDLESQAFDLWKGDVAQKKRAVMRAEVDELSKAWLKDIEPQREKERVEREERKRQRAEEREEERNRKAAERAAALEAEEQQQHEAQRGPSSSTAAPAPARAVVAPPPEPVPPPPPAAQSPSTSRVPRVAQPPPARAAPPPPRPAPSSSSKGKGKTSEADELILSDSESAPTSSSHFVAEQVSTTPTAVPPAEQPSLASSSSLVPPQQHHQHHRHQPFVDPVQPPPPPSSSKRSRAAQDERVEHDRPAQPQPATLYASGPPPTPRVEPAPAGADIHTESLELGVVDSQSLPLDEPSGRRPGDDGERRPSKKVKVRHAAADSPQQPFSLPGVGLVDYPSASEDEDAVGAGAVSQELHAPPTPSQAPARRAARSTDFGPPSHPQSASKTKEPETLVIDDDDE